MPLRFPFAAFALLASLGIATAQEPKPAPEKLYALSFDKTPWEDAFKWFAKESGLTYIDTVVPKGTLTIKSDRKYTLPQVVDLFNEALAPQKLMIYHRSQSFLVVQTDEPNPDMRPHFIELGDLHLRGDTEIVQVIIPLTAVLVEDVMPQMKKLLSPFGFANAFGTNQLIVMDKAKNIRSILHFIGTPFINNDQFSIACKYANANNVANQLRRLVKPSPPKESHTPPDTSWGSWPNGWGNWGGQPASQSTPERRFRSVQFYVDHATNTVRITGPGEAIAYAKELAKHIDVGTTPREIGGEELWKAYPVAEGTADDYLRLMLASDDFRDSNVRIQLAGASRLHVYGLPADHADVQNVLKMSPAFWKGLQPAVAGHGFPVPCR